MLDWMAVGSGFSSIVGLKGSSTSNNHCRSEMLDNYAQIQIQYCFFLWWHLDLSSKCSFL